MNTYSTYMCMCLKKPLTKPECNCTCILKCDFPSSCDQVLSKNRWTVLYCTLLAKAESDAERERIEEEMSADPEKKAILKVSFLRLYLVVGGCFFDGICCVISRTPFSVCFSSDHLYLCSLLPPSLPPSLPPLCTLFLLLSSLLFSSYPPSLSPSGTFRGGVRGLGAGGESQEGCSAQVSYGI